MAEGTGYPGQIQVRDPDTKAPVDVYGDAATGSIRVGLRYIDGSGVPTAQGQVALESSVQTLIDIFKWQFRDMVESGGYSYYGYEAADSTYRIVRVKDADMETRTLDGSGSLPDSGTWSGLSYT